MLQIGNFYANQETDRIFQFYYKRDKKKENQWISENWKYSAGWLN